jgi:uncharacterized phosphatase
MKLYFLRHGQSQANLDGLYAAQNETPLTELGRQQATQAGLGAMNLGIEVIISSPQSRAHDTARIVSGQIQYPEDAILLDSELREVSVGNLVGTTARGPEGYLEHEASPNGDDEVETLGQLIERMTLFSGKLENYTGKTVLLVGHNISGQLLKSILAGGMPHLDPTDTFPNGEIVEFEVVTLDGAQA